MKNQDSKTANVRKQISQGLTINPDGSIQLRGELAKTIRQDASRAGLSPQALMNQIIGQALAAKV